jgi:hypothetical protein
MLDSLVESKYTTEAQIKVYDKLCMHFDSTESITNIAHKPQDMYKVILT